MITKEQLYQWDRQIVWHAFTQMAEYSPLIFDRAEGCTLIDIEGNRYVDGVSSLWCNVHGHRHPVLDAAVRAQLDKVAHTTNLGASNVPAIVLAKRLIELAPQGLGHVFYSDNGATSVEVALKMAFQYWRQTHPPRPKRSRFVALDDAYHGDTLGSVSIGGVDRFHKLFEPLLFDVIRVPPPHPYRPPPGVSEDQVTEYSLGQLRQVLERNQDEIAAVVIEPKVQGAAGMLVHPPGFLRGVRELTAQYEVLMIADEVAVGFGRTGRMFASQHEQVTPDLMCLAKGITGGYMPMAATLTTGQVFEAFLGSHAESKTFFHGHTYGANPLAAAVALANLEVFEQERTLEKMPAKVERLAARLQRIAEHPFVGNVRQCGLMAGIELVRDKATKEPFAWEERRGYEVCQRMLRHGVWLRPLGDVLVVMPPLAISLDEIDTIGHAVEAALSEMKWN